MNKKQENKIQMNNSDKQFKKLFNKLDNKSAKPTPEWLASSRSQMQQHLKDNPISQVSQVEHFVPESIKRGWLARPVRVMASVLIAVLALGGGTTFVAQGAEPGDTLYPLKLAGENFNVFVNVSPEAKAKLYLKYADRRFDELEKLYEKEPENEYWQEKVVQNMGEQIVSAKDTLVKLEEQPEFIDVALEFESLTEDHDQRLEELRVKLSTTTEIINRMQGLNEIHKQKALQALEEAQEIIKSNKVKQGSVKNRVNARLELLKARQEAMRQRMRNNNSIKVKFDDGEFEYEEETEDGKSIKVYEVEFEDEGVYFESEVEVESEGNEKVETIIDVNNGQTIINSTIQATGTSIIINESNTIIATSSNIRGEVKGRSIRWKEDFFNDFFKQFGSKFKPKKDKNNYDDDKDEDESREEDKDDKDDEAIEDNERD